MRIELLKGDITDQEVDAIVNAANPSLVGGGGLDGAIRSHLLARCHIRALEVGDELGVRTIAFPAISTGAYGYPPELAAPVALAAVRESGTRVDEVRFVLFDDGTLDAFRRARG